MPLKHRGYGAYITCDGRELEQFQVKVESDKIVSCYVPGDTGTVSQNWESVEIF